MGSRFFMFITEALAKVIKICHFWYFSGLCIRFNL